MVAPTALRSSGEGRTGTNTRSAAPSASDSHSGAAGGVSIMQRSNCALAASSVALSALGAYFEVHALCKFHMYEEASALCLKYVKDASDKGGIKTKFFGPAAIASFQSGRKKQASKYVDGYLATGVLHEDEVVELSGLLRKMGRYSEADKLAAKGYAKFSSSPYVQEQLLLKLP